jgi:hypothetical protein
VQHHNLLGASLLILFFNTATPAAAQSDQDFEAAIKRAGPSATESSLPVRPSSRLVAHKGGGGALRYVGRSAYQQAPAPRGAIPPRWRTLKAMSEDLYEALDADVDAGRLDPRALLEQMSGPLPLPAGALPLDCYRVSMQLDFTMGMDLSPDLSRKLAVARAKTDTSGIQPEAELEAKPMIDELRRYFLAHGFREFRSGIAMQTGFFNEATKLRVDVSNMELYEVTESCRVLPDPIVPPNGPTLRYSNRQTLGPGETFIDDAGERNKLIRDKFKENTKRVTNPFG